MRERVKLPHARIKRKPVSKRPLEQQMEIGRVEPCMIVGIPGGIAEAPTVPSFREPAGSATATVGFPCHSGAPLPIPRWATRLIRS